MQNTTITLASGHEMPLIGLGTWRLSGQTCEASVESALAMGYRHIDTAEMYGNHQEIGKVLKETGYATGDKREDLFLTSKIWQDHLEPNTVLRQCGKALKELQVDYLDLLLIHWPSDTVPVGETLTAFAELVKEEKVRSIGVSNFIRRRVREAAKASKLPLSINQVECHPYLNQNPLIEVCREQGLELTAYSPLGRGKLLGDPAIAQIAEKTGRDPAQVVLRWQVQRGVVVIPKASSEDHLKTNFDIWGWELSDTDMDRLTAIEDRHRERFLDAGLTDFSEDD